MYDTYFFMLSDAVDFFTTSAKWHLLHIISNDYSTRLLSTWSTAVHQSQTFPADVIYGHPLDIT